MSIKNFFRAAAPAALCICIFAGGVATGQNAAKTNEAVKDFSSAKAAAMLYAISPNDAKNSTAPKRLANAYANVVRDPDAVRFIVASIIGRKEELSFNADSAPQKTQVTSEAAADLALIQVAQNQRIIELLEQLNKKK